MQATKASLCKIAVLSVAMLAAAAVTASAQQPAGDPVEVFLAKQDFSDCQNGNVQPPSDPLGAAVVQRNTDGTTSVKIGISATPKTKYNFFLKCVRLLGTLQTNDEGNAVDVFTFRTNETGNVFAFDMYPDGAPPGNKFQSVQVKMQ